MVEEHGEGALPEAEGAYLRFYRATKAAVAEHVRSRLELIATAAADPKHWTAAAWSLERRYPAEFGRRERHEHSGSVGLVVELPAIAPPAGGRVRLPPGRAQGVELVEGVELDAQLPPGPDPVLDGLE